MPKFSNMAKHTFSNVQNILTISRRGELDKSNPMTRACYWEELEKELSTSNFPGK